MAHRVEVVDEVGATDVGGVARRLVTRLQDLDAACQDGDDLAAERAASAFGDLLRTEVLPLVDAGDAPLRDRPEPQVAIEVRRGVRACTELAVGQQRLHRRAYLLAYLSLAHETAALFRLYASQREARGSAGESPAPLPATRAASA